MKARSIYGLAAIAALLAGVIAWRAHHGAALARQQTAAADKSREELAAERNRRLKQIAADRQLAVQAARAAAAAPVRARPAPNRMRPPGDMLAKLKGDPALQAKFLDAKRRKLASQYGALFRTLQLTPEQIAKLEDAIMDREGQKLDLAFAAAKAKQQMMINGSPYASDPIRMQLAPLRNDGTDAPDLVDAHKFDDQIVQSFQAAATGILGAEGASQLQQYESDLPTRNWVNDFNGSLAASGQAMTPLQVDQLTNAIVAAQPAQARGTAQGLFTPANDLNYDQAVGQASAVLSAGQLAALRQTLALPQAMSAFTKALMGATGLTPSPKGTLQTVTTSVMTH